MVTLFPLAENMALGEEEKDDDGQDAYDAFNLDDKVLEFQSMALTHQTYQ
jgi:hypothetical protein